MGDASRPSVPSLQLSADGVKKEEETEGATSINNVNVNNTDERPARRSIDVSMIKFPADVQDQLDNFEATHKRDPTDYKNLIDWGTCLSKYGASVLKNLKSMMKKSKEKNRLQWIETKEILFMACVKFQESFKLSPDQITLLEQWGDTLLLISTNYLVPLHELACEKFMQALTINPNSSALHAKYGVSLSKRAYYHQKQMFAIAGTKGVMPVNLTKPGTNQIWTPRELYNLADSHFNKAVALDPAEPKNWIYWAKSLHIRLEFARDSQAAIVLGNEISARYHQALAANENDSKVLQLWAKSIDLSIERYIGLAPYPEDKGQQDYLAAMLEFYLHCFQAFADTHPVPIKPLIAFAMLDDDKINQIAYQALREISHSCRNESNKIEAARNVTFLDTIYKTRYESNQANRQKALETLEALPDKARQQVSKVPLTDLDLMAIGQYYDIFLNCVHFALRRILVEEMEHDTKANKFYAFLKRRNQALRSMSNRDIALERKDLQLINNNNVNVNNAEDPNEPPSPREGDRSISASMNSYNSQMSDQMSGTNQSLGLRARRHSVLAVRTNGSTSLVNGKNSPVGENTPTGPHTGSGPRERRGSEPVRPSIDIEKIFKLEDPSLIYKHRQLIGKGGFGKVYISKEKVSKKTYRQVALKVSKNKIETHHQLQSVAHEISALRACKHRNIVNLLDAYMWNGHAWMVMEYCDGGALSTLLKDVVLTEQEISYIVRQITEGLHYLHSQKRVHRDIKADNILLNLNGEVKLADLGLVEELEEEPTTTSSTNDAIEDNRRDLTKQHNLGMAGSCYWMAPEIIKRQQFGSKVDIWSLGCVLYELIAQEPPYHGLGPLMAMFRTTTKGPPSLKDPRKWSDNLMDFLHLCWEVNPRSRPSAGALLEHPFFHQSYTFNTLSLTKKLETVFLDDVLRKGGMI